MLSRLALMIEPVLFSFFYVDIIIFRHTIYPLSSLGPSDSALHHELDSKPYASPLIGHQAIVPMIQKRIIASLTFF